MKVFLCYECYYDCCDEFRSLAKIVDSEEKALKWVLEWKRGSDENETQYRTFEQKGVE